MKLDRTFSRDISKISNGDGSREARINFLKTAKEVRRTLSTIEAPRIFMDCVKKYGRVPVAVCVAATIIDRQDRIDLKYCDWAAEVIKLYTNAPDGTVRLAIDDGLHPTRIIEYAGKFIKLTTEEWQGVS